MGCVGGTDTHVFMLRWTHRTLVGYRGVAAVAAAVAAALPSWAGSGADAGGAATICCRLARGCARRAGAGRRVDAGSLLHLCSDGLQAEGRGGRQVPQVLDKRHHLC